MFPFTTILSKLKNLFCGPGLGGRKKRQKTQVPARSSSPAQLGVWTLDQDLFRQVYEWNATHPDKLSDRFLNCIRTCIEQHKDFLEVFPDGPIPFRGFAKALAHVVKVGVTIIEAKAAALHFVEVILRWVEDMALRFEHGGSGPLVQQTWENLHEVRKLIDDVCAWAHAILSSGVSARISANDQILGFQRQFMEATSRFTSLSHINIADGIDDLKASLLGKVEFPDAMYGSQNKNPCDLDTRTEILDDIMKWINDVSNTSQCFFWLSGDPGTGKSAIAASVAKECMRRGILWAQFFINRNDARTVDPKILFPSLADQMSKSSPAVKHAVQRAYNELPYLLDEGISTDQASKLFVDTIRAASRIHSHKPVVIVIDALDETDITRLTNTVQIFAQVITDLPYGAKVFIASRAEEVILNYFRPRLISNARARHIHLSSDSKDSIDEVTRFIKRKIKEIMEEHQLNETHWGQERTDTLCVRASGLFIWAVTAIEYIRNQINYNGKECLRGLLDQLSAENMSDIDNLYRTILAGTFQHIGAPKQHADSWPLQRFRRIIGAILARQSPLCIADLEGLLDLRNSSGDSADIEHFVRRLRAILVAGDGEINGQTIPRVHRSFYDFITSRGAGDFRVDMVNSHGELAIQCIRQLKQLWELRTPAQAWYAILFWGTHMTGVQLGMKAEVAARMENDARPLSEANNTTTDPEPNICTWREVEVTNKGSNDDLREVRATGTDCMAVSPDVLKVVFVQDGMVHLRGILSGEDSLNWDLPAGDWVPSITFSPDGRYIVAPIGNDIYVWNSETGDIVLAPLQGHTGHIFSAFCSSYGTHIVSASADSTIRIWDSSTGKMLSVLEGHTDYVQSAVFSPDGQSIVSASSDKTICVWNVAQGNTVLGPLKGHDACVRFAAFTRDGKHIISCDFEHTILVWDSVTGERIPSFRGDADTAGRLCFTNVETEPYIITPTDDVSLGRNSGALSDLSYSFCVGERGVTGGRASNNSSWLYADLDNRFILPAGMGIMLGCRVPTS